MSIGKVERGKGETVIGPFVVWSSWKDHRICSPEKNKYYVGICFEMMQVTVTSTFFFLDNSLSILAKHNGFSRQKQEVYLLPIVISDSGNPPLSSTSTLTIRVCGCSNDGVVQSCNVEAYVLPIGLSMGALIAILACIILLLGGYHLHSLKSLLAINKDINFWDVVNIL